MYTRHVNMWYVQVESINMLMAQVQPGAAIQMTLIIKDVKMTLQPTWHWQATTTTYRTKGYHGIEWVCSTMQY